MAPVVPVEVLYTPSILMIESTSPVPLGMMVWAVPLIVDLVTKR